MNAKLKTAAGYWEAINRQTQTHIDTVRRIARQKGEGAVIGPETQAERSQRLAEEEAERKRRAAAAAKERRRAAAAAAAANVGGAPDNGYESIGGITVTMPAS